MQVIASDQKPKTIELATALAQNRAKSLSVDNAGLDARKRLPNTGLIASTAFPVDEIRHVRGADLSRWLAPGLHRRFGPVARPALDSLGNSGPHGLSEIIYLFASSNANNGSAFAGINGNTLWFNTTGGLVMLLGRFAYVVPVLALAGSLAAKKKTSASAGTFPTDGPLFVGLLVGYIVIRHLRQFSRPCRLGRSSSTS